MRQSADLQDLDQDSRRAGGKLLVRQGVWLEGRTCWQEKGYGGEIFLKKGVTVSFSQEKAETESDLFFAKVANDQASSISVKLLFAFYQEAAGEAFSFVSPSREAIYHACNNKLFLITPDSPCRNRTQLSALSMSAALDGQIWKHEKRGILNYVPMIRGQTSSVLLLEISIPAKKMVHGGASVSLRPLDKNV
ncbi:hypothetical protein FZD47_02165 [Bacillus infantis]|uniref:Uncharacterized protein n=1 Tax=Bacillus infantis TaxID=324767 RepID=A0A5D4SSG3_9BACI|nr:hypothetical protein [Bacillus infantis]TYS66315.1 hypothetical protein FZD47_02165 [Bacillus infantis]